MFITNGVKIRALNRLKLQMYENLKIRDKDYNSTATAFLNPKIGWGMNVPALFLRW